MTEGLCPHCGKWFRSLEIHLGRHQASDSEAKQMRGIQKLLKPKKRPKRTWFNSGLSDKV